MTTDTTRIHTSERTTSRDPVPFGAAAAVAGAVALAVTNAMVNWVQAQETYTTTADLLAMIEEHRTLLLWGDAFGLVAAVLLVPGIWAVAHRLGGRTPVLAGTGGWLAASGYVCFLVLVIEGQVSTAVVDSGGDRAAYVDALDNHTTLVQLAIYVVFGIGGLLGPLVLGVAMLRQRDDYPAWSGAALVLSPIVRMGGLSLGIHAMPAIASLMMALAFAVVMFRRR